MSAKGAETHETRRLTERISDLESKALEFRASTQELARVDASDVEKTLRYLSRLADLSGRRRIAVVGCGHRPKILSVLLERGHDAVGVEPVESYVKAASEYLGRPGAVLKGTAEDMPLDDDSQDVVLLEDVLEHVDSVSKTLAELYRVTKPGGVAYVKTNSRLRFSPSGYNAEFSVRFYNWLPALVKESYVHHHLHFDPSLAHFTTRPAVHWFDYGELCRAGREAGFARFYNLIDVVDVEDPAIARSRLRTWLVKLCKHQPWLHALALTQLGGYVFMYKRPESP